MALLGAVFNLAVYYPLRHRTYLPVIISTIGASIFLANTTLALYGPAPQVIPGPGRGDSGKGGPPRGGAPRGDFKAGGFKAGGKPGGGENNRHCAGRTVIHKD